MASPLKKRAYRLLENNPKMTVRGLQETLGCAKATAYKFFQDFKNQKAANPEGKAVRGPVLKLIRTAAEDLPPETQELVVEELACLMEYSAQLRRRAQKDMNKLKPIEHNQITNSINNIARSMQVLCDTYPGLAQLTTRKSKDRTGLQDADLADINEWLGVG